MRPPRRGASLLELLVAMPLLLLLSAVAVQLFVSQLQLGHRVGRKAHNVRELEQAISALAFDVRSAAAQDLESWTDTSVIVHVPVLAGYICAVPTPRTVDLVATSAAHPLGTTEHAQPVAGDQFTVLVNDSALTGLPLAALDSTLQRSHVQNVTAEPSACASSPLQRAVGGTPYRVTLTAALDTRPEIGAAVQLTRRTEWRAYRGSDGDHYLGRRDWDVGGWNTIQPVAGPLLSNHARGFRIRVLREDGRALAATHREAAWLDLALRMPRPAERRGTSPYDSLVARLALRGGR